MDGRFLRIARAQSRAFRDLRKAKCTISGGGTLLSVVSRIVAKGAKCASGTKCYCITTLRRKKERCTVTLLTYN